MDDIDEEEFIDFSTILSNTTTCNQSTLNDASTILETPKVDNQKRDNLNSTVDFTWINNEFTTLGYDPIINGPNRSIDQLTMANNLRKLLKTHRILSENYENTRDENLRIKREYEFLKKRAVNSKEETSDLGREANRLVENCKRLEGKLDEANRRARLLDDENRKMSSQIEQREKLFKIERAKFEKEANALKEKIYNLSHEKNRQYQYLNICETLPDTNYSSNIDPKEAKTIKKQMELSNALIKDYDRSRNQLVIEINDLKTFIFKILSTLNDSLRPTGNNLDYEKLLFSFSFDEVYKLLNSDFEQLIDAIKR